MTLAFRDAAVPPSPLSRWDARWKLTALLLAGVAVVSLRSPYPATVALTVAVGLCFLGQIPLSVFASRLGVLLLAVLPVVVVLPLTVEGGTRTAVTVALRAVTLGTLALVVLRTAPFGHTLSAAHRLYVPGVLVQIAQLAYRYSLLFFGETRRLRIALRTRGFRTSTTAHTYRTLGSSAGTLLVRGGDQAERVADAMRARGFDGTYHTLTAFRTTALDAVGFITMVAVFVGLVLWDRLA
jgi:cobalt/nickel transport system permease protein